MIQRIQTIYFIAVILICATLCTGSVIKVTEITSPGMNTEYNLNLFYFTSIENGIPVKNELQFILIALVALIIGLTVTIIFSFKDRPKQLKLGKVNYIIMLVLVLAVFAKAMMSIPVFSFGKLFPYSAIGMMLMAFLFYLNWRALRLVKKDDEMVKNSDRIR